MSDPLNIWKEKKEYLEEQLAITSDPDQKFTLRKRIEECEKEIARLNSAKKTTFLEPIREVLTICYRRALFTRTHAQLNHEAMFDSLVNCRVKLQTILFNVEQQDLHQIVANIIGLLDLIERERNSLNLTKIDDLKRKIINLLVKLKTTTGFPFSLPENLTEEIFFTLDEANGSPKGVPSLLNTINTEIEGEKKVSARNKLKEELVSILLEIPITTDFHGRSSLLISLPDNIRVSLGRDQSNAYLDIDKIINDLDKLGTLADTGESPLILIAQKALRYVDGAGIGEKLKTIIKKLSEV